MGTITTDAGTGATGSAGDGGMPNMAELHAPADVTVSPEGGYYIADAGNHKIRFVWHDLPAGTDVTPPDKPEIKRGPGEVGNNATPIWKFEAADDAVVTECKLKRGSTVVYDWERCTSPKNYDLRGEQDGTYTFYVDSADEAGNWSEAATDSYRFDQTPPAAPVIGGHRRRAAPSSRRASPSAAKRARLQVRAEPRGSGDRRGEAMPEPDDL